MRISVVIPTRGKADLLEPCLKALTDGTSAELEILVVEQGEECQEALAEKFPEVIWLDGEDGMSFSDLNNLGVKHATAPYLLLLNNDCFVSKGCVDKMAKVLEEREEVGVVGAKLLFSIGTIQHIGVVFDHRGVPYHYGYNKADDGTFGPANRSDDVDAVTFACAMIRRSVWDEIDGMDPAYFFNFEDIDFCLQAREKGHKVHFCHSAVAVHDEGSSGDIKTPRDRGISRNLKVFAAKWIESGRLEKVAFVKLSGNAPVFRGELPNIAFFPSSRDGGVPWWRIMLPAQKIAKHNLANVKILTGDEADNEKVAEVISEADIAVFQGFTSKWLVFLTGLGTQRSFPLAYDYDDHPIYISPFAEAYRWFGCNEIHIPPPQDFWLWRDGQSNFDTKRNQDNRYRQIEIFHRADLVTTTTVPLHEYFKTLNRKVTMLPNCIDFDLWTHMFTDWERKPGSPVRIGWHGGDNHFHDIDSIAEPLRDFVNSHDVKLILFGGNYRGPLKGIDSSKVEDHGWVSVDAFPWKLKALGIDIGLVPLADPSIPFMQFNRFKSEIKYLEYSALRTPTLVQAGVDPYAACQDGDNALTYSTPDEFTEKLGQLVGDADLRLRLGNAGLEWTHEYRDMDKNIHRWVDAYQMAIDSFADRKKADEIEELEAACNDEDLRPAGSSVVAEGAEA